MSIWKTPASIEQINAKLPGNMCEHVGIKITEIGDDYIKGTMPIDERTTQYMGILHGGASCVLAESLGSIGASLCAKPGYTCLGLDINANHLRPGKPPYVTGIARPQHIGNSTMVWEIKIYDTRDKLVCVSRLTVAVVSQESLNKKKSSVE